MKSMLLTAGLGERMLPLTERTPKPALPVLGRPVVIQLLRWLARVEPEHVVLNLHHLPQVLRDLVGHGGSHGLPPIVYSEEPRILGTAGGLRQAAPLLRGSGPIPVSNADALSDIDLGAAIATHRASGLPVTLVLTTARPGYSVVEVDAAGRVLALAGEPRVEPDRVADRLTFTGCHILDEAVLERIPRDGPSDIVRDVYRGLAADGGVGSYLHRGFWWEFGSPRLYLDGSLALIDECVRRGARVTEHDRIRVIDRAIVAFGAGARFLDGVTFVGRVALGFASHVGAECRIEDTVVMPEAWIGSACRLRRCVIAAGVELPARFEAEEALIVPATVTAGAGASDTAPLALPLGSTR